MDSPIRQRLRDLFHPFKQGELLDFLVENGQLLEFSPPTILLDAEEYIRAVPLVLNGLIRVYREDEQGREVLLYYIQPGQTCAMTLAYSLQDRTSRIKAVIEENTTILAIPVNTVHQLGFQFPSWQTFVATTFTQRFEEVLQVIEGIAFHRLDERLIDYLRRRANLQQSLTLHLSHQQIAADLATSREVISRLLKQLEENSQVTLARGKITLIPG